MTLAIVATTGSVLIAALLFLFWNSLRLVATSTPYSAVQRLEHLFQRRQELLMNLRDLESDFSLRKVEENDYHTLKEQFLHAAATIYSEIDDIEKNDIVLLRIEKDLETTLKDIV